MQQRIAWITGAGGLIGNYLVSTAPKYGGQWNVVALTRRRLDLSDPAALHNAFKRDNPHLIIHCAAMTKTQACQANPRLARSNNVEITNRLANLAAGIPFVFFSTDLVFDGLKGNYDESAAPNPLSVYAETKLAAEKIVLANPKHSVIRTSLNGGVSPTLDRSFNEELRNAWKAGTTLTLFTDEFRSPIPADITARAVWELIAQNRRGLFHVAGAERLSRFQIGQLVAARWPQLNPIVEPGSLKDYKGAPRSPDTSLNSAKAQRILSFKLPGLTQWLATHPEERF